MGTGDLDRFNLDSDWKLKISFSFQMDYHQCWFCPIIWLYFGIIRACTSLGLFYYSCFQWLYNVLRSSRRPENEDFLIDIRTPDNVDMGEYDVIEHGAARRNDYEETDDFGPGPSTSQGPSQRLCPKNKSEPIPIPRKPKPKKERFEPYRTSSQMPTVKVDKVTVDDLIFSLAEDHILPPLEPSSPPQSPAEPSPIFPMSDVE